MTSGIALLRHVSCKAIAQETVHKPPNSLTQTRWNTVPVNVPRTTLHHQLARRSMIIPTHPPVPGGRALQLMSLVVVVADLAFDTQLALLLGVARRLALLLSQCSQILLVIVDATKDSIGTALLPLEHQSWRCESIRQTSRGVGQEGEIE